MNAVEKRLEGERKAVRKLIRMAKDAGFRPFKVFEGEEYEKVVGETDTLEVVFSVDESVIYFRDGMGRKFSAFIVLGNSPEEVISDYGAQEDIFEHVIDPLFQEHMEWSEKTFAA